MKIVLGHYYIDPEDGEIVRVISEELDAHELAVIVTSQTGRVGDHYRRGVLDRHFIPLSKLKRLLLVEEKGIKGGSNE